MAIKNFKDYILEEQQNDNKIDNMLVEISKIIHKKVDINLDIKIDPHFNINNDADIQRTKRIICREYIEEYLNVLNEYGEYYVEGTGVKTNKYGEPVQNFAYNYINHKDFEKTGKEWTEYDENNRGIGKPVFYKYFQNVWSIACERVANRHKNKSGIGNRFDLKLDHRYKNNKNNDFDGYLVIIKAKDNTYWKASNLPKNQRYN